MNELEKLNERIAQLTELVKNGSEAIKSMEAALKTAEEVADKNGILNGILDKTIPHKVKRDPFGVECPNCGGRVVLPSTYTFDGKKIGIRCDYCYSCGQALDWSEK